VKWTEGNLLTSPLAQEDLAVGYLQLVLQQFQMKQLLWIVGEVMFVGGELLPGM
jgi:hypothetical protein